MALQDASGIITAQSGGGITSGTTLQLVAAPMPIMIVGTGAGLSGLHIITDFSGALNVNISGGSVTATTSISGNIVLVVSGGAIQISGTVRALVSGDNVVISGIFSLSNVSGGITVSGSVQVSGTVAVSGQVIVTSGGTIPVAILSGAQNISGGVTVSGGVTISGGVSVSGFVSLTSGAVVWGYQWARTTTAVVTNIQSGASVLHSVSINTWISGGQLRIDDSMSGVGGTTFAIIDFIETTAGAMPPTFVLYDAYMKSGIVTSTSGAIDVTVTYKSPV